jgi:hypothetical protein
MRFIVLLLMLGVSAPALAQHKGRDKGHDQGQKMSSEDRRKLREDVDSAKGNYGRQDRGRHDRMAPEDREKLRRDVQDANRDLRRR